MSDREATVTLPAVQPDGRARRPAPELLAPAGDWDCARAAVENGADGIYFGLDRFNARMRARNFTVADLPELMPWLHRRGVRGYVTFNTLVFADELAEAEAFLRSIIAAGVDAAIVQDVGIARLIRALSPDFPIHASTQMSITSAAGVEFARALGCTRVILARECPVAEIERIHRALSAAGDGPPSRRSDPGQSLPPDRGPDDPGSAPELEVFVHGALCVAYSGQCLTSESLGGRSANRGECAQACRMPLELICDGQPVPLGDRRYLLSPQDLAGLEVLPELIRAGVSAVKIEGRLKAPEYVAQVTRVYRQALDRLAAAPGIEGGGPGFVRAEDRYALEMAFSRGLYTGWLRGINHQRLVHGRFGKKRGVYLGEVRRVQGQQVFVRLLAPLRPGEGIVFDAGRPDQDEQGGRVYSVEPRGTETALSFGRGDLDVRRVHVGDRLWKTSDPELERRVRQTFTGEAPRFQRPVNMEVQGRAGEALTLVVRDDDGNVVTVHSEVPLVVAERQPLTVDRLRDQLGRLGGTPFKLGALRCQIEGALILPVRELNRLRRQAVEQLEALRARPRRWVLADTSPLTNSRWTAAAKADAPIEPELIVLVRNLAQLEAAWNAGVRTLYCEFEDPKRYRDAVARFREWQRQAAAAPASGPLPPSLWVAPPRITKPGEEWILRQVRSCDADGYLVRNYDHLSFFVGCRRVGDFSLNVANPLTAGYFLRRFGLERLTASYDLNAVQLEALLRAAPPEWFEITIHQHMPMFHMEHCVFCAFLSSGTDYTNCGRPCDRHAVELRDRVGAKHPVKADAGCRNTVFNALAQTGAEYVPRLLALGARRFRVEFLNEAPEEVTRTVELYRRLLRGELSGTRLWRELKVRHQLGVTRGPMDRGETRLPRWGEIEW